MRMSWRRLTLMVCMILSITYLFAQKAVVTGTVSSSTGEALPSVTILIAGTTKGTVTKEDGTYRLPLAFGQVVLVYTSIGYQTRKWEGEVRGSQVIDMILQESTTELESVQVTAEEQKEDELITSGHRVDAKSAASLPSTFGDFNKVLVTLPGVTSNNELSSAYSVRGGNFDENLVYVNDIPVYRPFLANAGRQEGLSFVNPDMVEDIEFYAGGWEPKYGDKMSSSLNIEYKTPTSSQGKATLGLLGGAAFYGNKNGRLSYAIGARHRDSRYLLNTLEVDGQYFPTYSDVQALLSADLTSSRSTISNRSKLDVLLSYGRNRYLSLPQSQTTEFGSIQANFRIETGFIGREIMQYNTYQGGFRFTHRLNKGLRTHLIGSMMHTREEENFDVEGAYRLCDVETNPSAEEVDECAVVRGIGTDYDYGRNRLNANIATLENRWEMLLNAQNVIEAGVGIQYQNVDDQIQEYSFVDSADYVSLRSSIFNDLALETNQYFAYIQNTTLWGDSAHAMVYGLRFAYWDGNGQGLISPRVAYRYVLPWQQLTTLKLSVGLYQQPPFYRELRNDAGLLQDQVYAQKSLHFIASMTRRFKAWERPFLLSAEVYHKQLYDIIPYDIDNLRLRYHPEMTGTGFAHGFDFRINGEFVKGTQSWFSLGFLRTQEDLAGDSYIRYTDRDGVEISPGLIRFFSPSEVEEEEIEIGKVRRPSDQRLTLGAFFEDHMPNDPSLRIYLNLVIGSGYPFGPPGNARLRNAFSGDEYYRLDIGLSKYFDFPEQHFLKKVWIRAEVLNALGADNTLSYTWKQDVNGTQFAIPNSLSARFFNLKLTVEI